MSGLTKTSVRSDNRKLGAVRSFLGDWGGKFTLAYTCLLTFHLLYVNCHWGGPEWASLISNLVAPAIYSGPCILAWRASKETSLSSRRRAAWRFIALANLCFMAGEITWLILENGLGLTPFPSIADAGYLAFYPLMMAGLLLSVEKFRSGEERLNFWLDASIVILAGGMVMWRVLVVPILDAAGEDHLKTILSVAYPVADLVLLLGISSLMLRRSQLGSRSPFNLVLLGVVINFLADFIFAYQSLEGTYSTGAPVDALFTLACFPVMIGSHLEKIGYSSEPVCHQASAANRSRYYWLPYIAVATVYLILLYGELVRSDSDIEIMFIVAGVVAVLVIVRQYMYLRENTRTSAELNSLQRRIQGIYSASSDAIALALPDGTLTEVNDAFVRLTGFDREELLGMMSYRDFIPDDSIDLSVAPDITEAAHRTIEIEHELTRKDGAKRNITAATYAVDIGDFGPTAIAVVIRDITRRRSLERELAYQARHDALTGLVNRTVLNERASVALRRAERRRSHTALMYIDLDNFKMVNDTLGHAAGDELLIAIASRIRSCLRVSDTAARLGGDEFAVVLEDLTEESESEGIAIRIIEEVQKAVELNGKQVFVGASIGIATNRQVGSVDELVRKADVAMYAAKHDGKNRFAVFEPFMQDAVMGRAKLETELRRAIDAKQFEVKYQPIVDLHSGQPVGVEALLRWNHPYSEIGPNEFIPVAEEANLISELGAFVVRKACSQAAEWNNNIRLSGRIALTINVSSREFNDEFFVDRLVDACTAADFPPTELVLEITESAMLSNSASTFQKLEELKALGVRLAIDDFGTGYSSLSYLHRFPIDYLKIDRSFVEKVTDRDKGAAMVRAIVTMATALGLRTIAEGIETELQAETLRQMGCTRGQGYLFSTPLSSAQMNAFLFDSYAIPGLSPADEQQGIKPLHELAEIFA